MTARVKAAAIAVLLLPALLAGAAPSLAMPDFSGSRTAGSLTVYSDDARRDVFYYGPGDLALATTADGAPDLHLLYARYFGTAAAGDAGARLFRSLLTFTVVMRRPTGAVLQEAKTMLVAAGAPAAVELRPLPLARLDAALVYTPIGAAAPDLLTDSELEPAGSDTALEDNAYWSRRTFAVGLDPETAQLMWQAMERGQVAMSVGYAFYARGLPPDRPIDSLQGRPEIVSALRKKLDAHPGAPGDAAVLVRAGALGVTADRQKWPALFRRVDLNASLPPAYGVLPVYCYDFNNGLRPDLYEIDVELDAEGLNGRRVLTRVVFRGDQPDVYVRSLRFAVAVRLDRPYRYRTLLVTHDGEITAAAWQSRETWAEALMIASRPDVAPHAVPNGEER